MCVRACVRVCMRACVCVCVFVCVCAARGVAWIWEEHGVCRASLAWISEVSMLIHHVQTWLQPWHVLSFLHLPSLFSCSYWCNTDYLLVAASNLLHSCSVVGVLVLCVQCTCSSSCGSTTSVYRRTMYTVSCHVHCVLSCTLCPVMYTVSCHVHCVLSCTLCPVMYTVSCLSIVFSMLWCSHKRLSNPTWAHPWWNRPFSM